ncbi:MAG: amidohydrolase family protein [Planctomycetota bacterium]|nr:amidohydrolase family protein [Planctomycetota bacterium]
MQAIFSLLQPCLLACGLAAAPAPFVGDEPVPAPTDLFVRAAKLHVRPGRVIDNGMLWIHDGRILAVGTDIKVPKDAKVIEGKVVCPGFIDSWSSFALEPNALRDDRVGPSTLAVDAVDSFVDARHEQALLNSGVTAFRVQPAIGARATGVGAMLRTHPTRPFGETTVLADACVATSIGLSRDGRAIDVFDRVTSVDRVVGALADGLAYHIDQNEYRHELAEWEKKIADKQKELEEGFKKAKKDREKAQTEAKDKGNEFKDKEYKEDKKPKAPRYDADKEILGRVAAGELPLVVEVHRALEIRALLEGTERFERLRLVLAGASEAAQCAEALKERRVPVIVWPQPLPADRPSEYRGANLALAAELAHEGVEVLIGSGANDALATRDLPLLAALAVGHGLSPEEALAALTTRPARVFDCGDQLGTLELGRQADVLVLDGEPFSATTKVRLVISGGEVVVGEVSK